jgi:hypothetical protein
LFEGKVRVYHRVAYCKHHGISHTEIVGLVVRHRCDNPRCINPEHLEIGTQLDNVRDCIERGRERKPKGMRHRDAKLTDDIVRQIRAEYKKRSKTHGNEALARKYGVCTDTIYLCVARKTWRHI